MGKEKRELSPFGTYFQKLRKKHSMSIAEASKLLDASPAYISAIEHGDREIPKEWFELIISIFNLNESDIEELRTAIKETHSNHKISLDEIERSMLNMIENIAISEEQKIEMKKELKRRLDDLKLSK